MRRVRETMERYVQILPLIIMVESFLASIPLAISGKWGSSLYWFAAGILNFSVIFLIKKMG